ncbi:hypothetical protein [Kitasatospora sp. NPDC001547]|uniref:hypothetical protein n=1 Tax=Kitasatospora sp. NPDC001547 TaxID=3364015 RepID=UPI0036B4380A
MDRASWDRRPGRRPLRAELLNWLATFADVARRPAEEGVGAAQDLAAARAVRPALHTRVAGFCQGDDPQVKEAAVAAVALLLADPALAPSVAHHVPAVRSVLAESANSYYRWIARDRLRAWGQDVAVLLTAEEDGRVARSEASALAANPFDEGRIEAIQWLAAQAEDTAAAEPLSRWHQDWTAPVTASPDEPGHEQPTTAQGHWPGYRGPWRIARDEERAEWTFTPYIGVGPLHFGMTLVEIATALDETPASSSWYSQDDGTEKINFADFTTTGVRALFENGLLACLAVNALTGPQVRLDGAPLTGCAPSRVEDWLVHRTAYGRLRYSPAGDPVFLDLGVAIRSQRAGDVNLTRPLFLLHGWLDLWDSLPREEWDYR